MESKLNFLLVDSDYRSHDVLRKLTAQYGYGLTIADHGNAAVNVLSGKRFDMVLADSGDGDIDGVCLINMIKVVNPESHVILMGEDEVACRCFCHLRGGWDDFIRKPLHEDELKFRTERCIETPRITGDCNLEYMHRISILENTLAATLRTLAKMVETREPYMAGHQQGVSDLAEGIAIRMGLPETDVEMVRIAGAIHDIGKISVPSEILNKPGDLTDYEFAIVRNHPQVGHDITRSISFPWPLAKILHQHHERWDGSGYPMGLAGEDIHIGARILSVADVVEAMSARRTFRSAQGIDDGLSEIMSRKDIFYDPTVVNACLKLFD